MDYTKQVQQVSIHAPVRERLAESAVPIDNIEFQFTLP